jgi:hypothetical protein
VNDVELEYGVGALDPEMLEERRVRRKLFFSFFQGGVDIEFAGGR